MDLKFDDMVVDTSLAREHLGKEKELSKLYENYEELTSYVYDGTFNRRPKTRFIRKDAEKGSDLTKKLNNLAKNIMMNANLIAGLEYLIRRIPIEDTKTQIEIIYKYLMCHAPVAETPTIHANEVNVPVYTEDHLLTFGSIRSIVFSQCFIFTATRATAYVAHLFVKLCHNSGLDSVRLEFTDDGNLPLKNQEDWESGTVGVVSEDADIDSAVDKFIATSKVAPWRLRKILVQESVYQQFKDALTWKCNLQQKREDKVESNTLCSDTLTYDGKIFVIDPVELIEDPSVVTVEAYRTRKEMISMLQEGTTHYLSLWSNGIAGINEVTYKTKAPVVWVNNLAEFGGPTQISQAVYGYKLDELKIECENVLGLDENWQKLSTESRHITLNRVIDKSDKFISREVADNIRDALADCSMKSFVHEGDGYVCVGSSSPVGTILVTPDAIFTPRTFKSLLYGNAILALGKLEMQDFFAAELLPIASIKQVNRDYSGVPVHTIFDCRYRAVWTNSGTIFAN